MIRKAFVMAVRAGSEAEYARRHQPIWNELAAVLKECRLHVGADSGVLHLAVAVGLPTVSLFRDYHDSKAWMPAGSAHRVLSVPCACVNQPNPPCDRTGRARCLAELSPASVAQAVQAQLSRKSTHAV